MGWAVGRALGAAIRGPLSRRPVLPASQTYEWSGISAFCFSQLQAFGFSSGLNQGLPLFTQASR